MACAQLPTHQWRATRVARVRRSHARMRPRHARNRTPTSSGVRRAQPPHKNASTRACTRGMHYVATHAARCE
eukprot:2326245-Pleurochrysis_carterae.AAC.1